MRKANSESRPTLRFIPLYPGNGGENLRSDSPESDYSGNLRPEVQVVTLKTVDFTYGPKRLRTSGPGPQGRIPDHPAHLGGLGSLSLVGRQVKNS